MCSNFCQLTSLPLMFWAHWLAILNTLSVFHEKHFFLYFGHIVSWEPEGRYCHKLCTAIAPFWFSSDDMIQVELKQEDFGTFNDVLRMQYFSMRIWGERWAPSWLIKGSQLEKPRLHQGLKASVTPTVNISCFWFNSVLTFQRCGRVEWMCQNWAVSV